MEFVSEDPPLRFKAPALDEGLADVNRLEVRRGDYRGHAYVAVREGDPSVNSDLMCDDMRAGLVSTPMSGIESLQIVGRRWC